MFLAALFMVGGNQVGSINKRDTTLLFLIFLLLMIQFSWGYFNEYYNLRQLLFVAFSAVLAMAISKIRSSVEVAWLPFYITGGLLLLLILSGIDPERVLVRNSRNFLSVVMLGLFASAVVLSKPPQVSKNHILAAFLTIVISVLSEGRAGIIASVLLMVLVLAKGALDERRVVSSVIRNAILVTVLMILLAAVADSLLELVPRLRNRGLHDFSRMTINLMYFQGISFSEFIFGRNYFEIFFLQKFGYNLHNSYLAAWANLGIAYLGLIAFCLLKSVLKRREWPFFWIVLFCLGLRAITDVQMLGAKYDYLFLTMLFLGHRHVPNLMRSKAKPDHAA